MDQNTKNPAGWPLDELQKGDFIYNVPADKVTLTEFAKEVREDILQEEEKCRAKKESKDV